MFAIYFPGRTGANPKHFHDVGLSDVLGGDADRAPTFVDFSFGPDGKPGVAATWLQRPIIAGEFEWTPVTRRHASGVEDQAPAFFLGRAPDRRATPQDFQRDRVQLGTDVTLADGNEWHFAVARQLPQLLALDSDDKWSPTVAPAYKRFFDDAWKTLDWFVPDERGVSTVDFQAGADFVVLALSINYRVNRDVASWLGLIRSDLFWPVARAVTELDALQKKTDSGGQLTSAGDGG